MPKKKASQKPIEVEEEPEWLGDVLSKKTGKKNAIQTHYGAVHLEEGMDLRLGDIVKVHSEEKIVELMVLRVDALYEDEQGVKMFSGHYFYHAIETDMAFVDKRIKQRRVEVDQDPRRLFLASDEDNASYPHDFALNTIECPTTVHWVPPGTDPPGPDVCEFWYDQQHSRSFMTFRDICVMPAWQQRLQGPQASLSERFAACTSPNAGTGADDGPSVSGRPWYDTIGKDWHFGPNARQRAGRSPTKHKAEVYVLELCCGVGGLSFVCEEGIVDGVHAKIIPMWAVDYNQDAITCYRVNHPKVHAYCMGIDEFLMFAKFFDVLCEHFPADREKGSTFEGPVEWRVCDLRFRECALRGTKGQAKGQLLGPLLAEECWVECAYFAFNKEHPGKQKSGWMKVEEMLVSSAPLVEALGQLVDEWRTHRRLPQRSNVGLIAGGPPCQGMSGLNRHKAKEDILGDAKNRLVTIYLEIIRYFRPGFVLTEQVLDILKNENGRYARYVLASLCAHRYQCRIGVIPAGHHGVAQGRYRCFVWSAAQGLVLPSFPEPTHRVLEFNRALKTEAKPLYVQRLTDEDDPDRKPWPLVLLGDVYSDLPEVHNYTMTDSGSYKCAPLNPFQRWMRRAPPPGTPSLVKRAQTADVLMRPNAEPFEMRLRRKARTIGMEAVGREFLCGNQLEVGFGDRTDSERAFYTSFEAMTWNAHLARVTADAPDPDALVRVMEMERTMTEAAFCHELGRIAIRELSKAKKMGLALAAGAAPDLVRDHRPLMCNADDWLRMVHVPRRKNANFRQMPGVVGNEDGTSCAGHAHILVVNNGKPTFKPGCPAGGKIKPKKKGNSTDNRVENYDKDGWRGSSCPGCKGQTYWLPSGDLVCKRWCVTYKSGKSNGRHGCFGRAWHDELQPTVVGRAEPHNLALLHAEQDRVVTIRENARCQGFPDYWVLCALGQGSPMSRNMVGSISSRYQQMGNAVAPPVASALGRCLVVAIAAEASWDIDRPVIPVPDVDMEESYAESARLKEEFHSVVHNVVELDGKRGAFKRKATTALQGAPTGAARSKAAAAPRRSPAVKAVVAHSKAAAAPQRPPAVKAGVARGKAATAPQRPPAGARGAPAKARGTGKGKTMVTLQVDVAGPSQGEGTARAAAQVVEVAEDVAGPSRLACMAMQVDVAGPSRLAGKALQDVAGPSRLAGRAPSSAEVEEAASDAMEEDTERSSTDDEEEVASDEEGNATSDEEEEAASDDAAEEDENE